MRIGILGYGAIATQHALALSAIGCELVEVAGPNLEAAETFGRAQGVARATNDAAGLISSDDIDGVVIASPNAVHAGQALQCLEHGKHVLCEVPLGLSIADVEQVARLSGAVDRRFMVCQTQRFLRPVQLLREQVPRETIKHVIIRLVLNRTSNVGITGRARSWSDSLVWHHGSHAVDTALWLLGDDVVEVAAFGAGGEEDAPLDFGGLIRTASGAIVTLALSYTAQRPSTDFMVIGEGETLIVERGALTSSSGRREEFDPEAVFVEAVSAQDAAFVEAVETGVDASPTPAELLRVYRTLGLLSDDAAGRNDPSRR